MAEYIEREEAIRMTLKACLKVVGHAIPQDDAMDVVDMMESIPTADVVPVVRCKDCRHFKTDSYYCQKTKQGYCELDNNVKQKQGYCSYGERRCEE